MPSPHPLPVVCRREDVCIHILPFPKTAVLLSCLRAVFMEHKAFAALFSSAAVVLSSGLMQSAFSLCISCVRKALFIITSAFYGSGSIPQDRVYSFPLCQCDVARCILVGAPSFVCNVRQPVSMSVHRQYTYGQQYCRNYTVSFSSHRFLLFSSGHGLLSMGAAVCHDAKTQFRHAAFILCQHHGTL